MGDIRALLVTDVVDSTKLSEKLGDAAMAALWAVHDLLARDLIRTYRGREIDKSDGFLLLFDGAPDAVAFALAYHQALRTMEPPLQARVGLHVGEVILTENAPEFVARGAKPIEVDGLAKPTTARVIALGNLGNVLRFVGEHAAAVRHLEEALAVHRRIGFTWGQPTWLGAMALIEADARRCDAALELAHEAVAVAAPFPSMQVNALVTLARVHLACGGVPAAREAIVRARALSPQRVAELAAVDALVAVAEGDGAAARAALAEATAEPSLCLPGSEVAQLVARARDALESRGG